MLLYLDLHAFQYERMCNSLSLHSGGDTIRQLMVQSGAHIELFRGPQPNEHEKLFSVRGTAQQIQSATQLIQQKIEAMVSGCVGVDSFRNSCINAFQNFLSIFESVCGFSLCVCDVG